MNIQIEAFRDYVMIGTQRVERPVDIPAHIWVEDWDWMVKRRQERVFCPTCNRQIREM